MSKASVFIIESLKFADEKNNRFEVQRNLRLPKEVMSSVPLR